MEPPPASVARNQSNNSDANNNNNNNNGSPLSVRKHSHASNSLRNEYALMMLDGEADSKAAAFANAVAHLKSSAFTKSNMEVRPGAPSSFTSSISANHSSSVGVEDPPPPPPDEARDAEVSPTTSERARGGTKASHKSDFPPSSEATLVSAYSSPTGLSPLSTSASSLKAAPRASPTGAQAPAPSQPVAGLSMEERLRLSLQAYHRSLGGEGDGENRGEGSSRSPPTGSRVYESSGSHHLDTSNRPPIRSNSLGVVAARDADRPSRPALHPVIDSYRIATAVEEGNGLPNTANAAGRPPSRQSQPQPARAISTPAPVDYRLQKAAQSQNVLGHGQVGAFSVAERASGLPPSWDWRARMFGAEFYPPGFWEANPRTTAIEATTVPPQRPIEATTAPPQRPREIPRGPPTQAHEASSQASDFSSSQDPQFTILPCPPESSPTTLSGGTPNVTVTITATATATALSSKKAFLSPIWLWVAMVGVLLLVGVTVGVVLMVTPLGQDDPKSAEDSTNFKSDMLLPYQLERYHALHVRLEYLSSDPSVLDDVTSPQHKALFWLAQDDVALDDDATNAKRIEVRYGLVVFFYASQGAKWLDRHRFATLNLHECNWTSTVLSDTGVSKPSGVVCDDDWHVTGLSMVGNYASNKLPEEFFALTDLTMLDLSKNGLQGALSDRLIQLTKLTSLDLSDNFLSSTLPNDIGRLGKLQVLRLGGNDFVGPLSDSFSLLIDLVELNVTDNMFTGAIFEQSKFYVEMYIEKWGLLKSLEVVDISSNDFTGTIPTTIAALEKLSVFRFGVNGFIGSLPDEMTALESLSEISGHRNNFVGTFPWPMNNSTLRSLDMGENRLTGSLPTDIGRFSNTLTTLFFESNRLAFTLPSSLGQLTKLQTLSLQRNRLTGSLPTSLGNLEAVELIDISGNLLEGTIPTELAALQSLDFFYLHDNYLTGDIQYLCSSVTSIFSDSCGTTPKVICGSCCSYGCIGKN